ncbi:MAG: hypothetical protein QM803_15690 [Rhodocyclaceae bacterium]
MMNRSTAGAAALSVLAALTLSACGGSANTKPNSVNYKSGAPASRNTLEVPPDLIAPTRDDRFAIPDASTAQRGSASLSNLRRRSGSFAGRIGQAATVAIRHHAH